MRVSLIDLDVDKRTRQKFPNLALMKLSAYHKAKGGKVSLNFPLDAADCTYVSCVFTWHKSKVNLVPDEAQVGGSGISLISCLPHEIEHIMPDYDLYAGVDYSMGYTSR